MIVPGLSPGTQNNKGLRPLDGHSPSFLCAPGPSPGAIKVDVSEKDATFISAPEFLQSIIARGQYWGNKIGAQYGEPFLVREAMKLDDPVAHFSDYKFAGLQ